MASRANLYGEVFTQRAAGGEFIAATTSHFDVIVARMYVDLH